MTEKFDLSEHTEDEKKAHGIETEGEKEKRVMAAHKATHLETTSIRACCSVASRFGTLMPRMFPAPR